MNVQYAPHVGSETEADVPLCVGSETEAHVPLCVDLDGTLLKTDTLVEGYLRCVKQNGWYALAPLLWLLRGKAYMKSEIARRAPLDVNLLPVDAELLAWLLEEHLRGRHLVLCTAAVQSVAEKVAERFGIFDEVIGSDPQTNRAGPLKASALGDRFGETSFDYVGNEKKDLHIWKRSRRAIVVRPTFDLRRRLATVPRLERVFGESSKPLATWARALRLHQWLKNLLLFLPMIASHQVLVPSVVGKTLLAFLWFGVCASATYLINDLMDLDADRMHARKRSRPFAAGDLPLIHGIVVPPLIISLAVAAAALTVNALFALVLIGYVAATLWYSAILKRIGMVDVLALAGLYTLRIIAGSIAIAVTPSFWLLLFSMFMFLSLAMVKRYTELRAMLAEGVSSAAGRGYSTDDLPLLESAGISAGFISVLVLALYINEGAEQFYTHPAIIWLICPLVFYWICRVWRKTHRSELHDDPVVFAARDRPSLLVAALCALLIWAAV